jgi:hypothetical protein
LEVGPVEGGAAEGEWLDVVHVGGEEVAAWGVAPGLFVYDLPA